MKVDEDDDEDDEDEIESGEGGVDDVDSADSDSDGSDDFAKVHPSQKEAVFCKEEQLAMDPCQQVGCSYIALHEAIAPASCLSLLRKICFAVMKIRLKKFTGSG